MTTRPHLNLGRHLLAGLSAVALFVVMAAVFMTAPFGRPFGFGDGSITASIGYAMFAMTDLAAHDSESFLVAFEIIDIVLVAALVGAVMLARREEDGSLVTALTDGGTEPDSRQAQSHGETSEPQRTAPDGGDDGSDEPAHGGDD